MGSESSDWSPKRKEVSTHTGNSGSASESGEGWRKALDAGPGRSDRLMDLSNAPERGRHSQEEMAGTQRLVTMKHPGFGAPHGTVNMQVLGSGTCSDTGTC